MKKRIITALLLVILMLSACSSSKETDVKSIETGIDSINKYGNIPALTLKRISAI